MGEKREGPRSFDRFKDADFALLAALADRDLAAFVARNPRHARLPFNVLATVLGQGAAQHHLDGRTGVKDFDVWTFFYDDGSSPHYPVRRVGTGVFHGSRFGGSTGRIDFLGRTLDAEMGNDPVVALRHYLTAPPTRTAWRLSRKAMILLSPPDRRGDIVWPANE